jgi:GH24 family phage-related lysozyme (muramidase)
MQPFSGYCPNQPGNIQCCAKALTPSLTNDFTLSDSAVQLIASYEGFFPQFYMDPVNIPTIGFGHACHVNDCTLLKFQMVDGSTYERNARAINAAPK